MKKLVLIAVCVLAVMPLVCQTTKLDKLIAESENTPGYTVVKVSKSMFKFLGSMNLDNNQTIKQIKPLMDKMESLKLISTGYGFETLAKKIINEINNLNYDELVSIKDNDDVVKMLIEKPKNNVINNFIMITYRPGEANIIILNGNFEIADFENLINDKIK